MEGKERRRQQQATEAAARAHCSGSSAAAVAAAVGNEFSCEGMRHWRGESDYPTLFVEAPRLDPSHQAGRVTSLLFFVGGTSSKLTWGPRTPEWSGVISGRRVSDEGGAAG
mmetsp:Transcript_56835/g.120866  ORF Transcript_56835/g.120866 Transcript_56835/m.120866 type:complete len:111 (-) Transcript_56835:17-349(-)